MHSAKFTTGAGHSSPTSCRRAAAIFYAVLPVGVLIGAARAQTSGPPASSPNLLVTVRDETGVVVASVQLTLSGNRPEQTFRGETDAAGRCEFRGLPPGRYHLRAEKEGFYALQENPVAVGETDTVDVTLNHQHEYVEQVNVAASPPSIDPAQTVSKQTLGSREIVDLPYTVTRDIRFALPLLPGVVQDATGQVHVDGADSPQTSDLLDGFRVNGPAFGLFQARVNVDALRSVSVASSRYPVESGEGSGGVLNLNTGMGDDRFRFSGTDFLPSLQSRKGIHVNSWTPRATFSGPIRKGRAWFLLAPDGEYDLNIVKELPAGADRASAWRISNLAKAQVNLTTNNILTGTFLINRLVQNHAGLDRFDPISTTQNVHQGITFASAKDQAVLANGTLVEVGFAGSRYSDNRQPLGDATYVISPGGTSGNFFESSVGTSNRWEGLANLTLPRVTAWGRHEFKLGLDLDRTTYQQTYGRRPFQIVRADGTLDRFVTFSPHASFVRDNFDAGVYGQDRWWLTNRWLVEPGVRLDWDEIIRDVLPSPRFASTYLLTRRGDTKLVGGVGIYYDQTSLFQVALPLGGTRTDVFYDSTGAAPAGPPILTSFQADEQQLKEPRYLNWSAGLERTLPGGIVSNWEFLEKRERDGFTYINQCSASPCFSGLFQLQNVRRDRYDSARVSVRKAFRGEHSVFASYTHSSARSNAVLDFTLENPLFSQQVGGPLFWDVPNRLLSWGFLPLLKGYDLAYILDWHSGFPFALVNQNQQLVAPPGAAHFPAYFSLNLALERRFHVFGYEWALRAGFNDITNRANPSGVDNNVDSPTFLTFGGIQGRVLTTRIRLLGRK